MSTRKEFRKLKKKNLENKKEFDYIAIHDRPAWADDEKLENEQKFNLTNLLAEVAEANKIRDKKE